jgi:MoxR-like ATPase
MLKFSDLPSLFKAAFFCYGENGRCGLPLFFLSPPGESKTSQARAYAKAAGVWFGSLEGARLDAVDVAGLPQFTTDGNAYRFVPPAILRDAAKGPGLLLLDELTRATPAVQASFLTLLLEGRTEGVQLDDACRIWGAANPAGQVGGVDLDPANGSRLLWVQWPSMTAEDWTRYLLGADNVTGAAATAPVDYAAEMQRLQELWPAAVGRARALVAGFLSAQGSRLRETAPEEGRAWANPRTWSMATRALAATILHDSPHNVAHTLVGGCIGEGNATALLTWIRQQDLPAARDVLSGKVKLPLDANRIDRTLAVLTECAAVAEVQQAEKLWDLVSEAAAVSVEVAIVGMRAVRARGDAFRSGNNQGYRRIMTNPQLMKIAATMQEIGGR